VDLVEEHLRSWSVQQRAAMSADAAERHVRYA
jgi:hypothetical protein